LVIASHADIAAVQLLQRSSAVLRLAGHFFTVRAHRALQCTSGLFCRKSLSGVGFVMPGRCGRVHPARAAPSSAEQAGTRGKQTVLRNQQ
jgi:hypothetical protein